MVSIKFEALFFILFSVMAMGATAQVSVDSLNNVIARADETGKNPRYVSLIKSNDEIPILLSADSIAKIRKNIRAQAAINEALGYAYHNIAPDSSIACYQQAYTFFKLIDNRSRAAQCLHNIAFEYDEQKHDIPDAAKYTRLAIEARTELKDTLAMANMYKYLGYLQGKTHEFGEAKQNIATAIKLFTIKKFTAGVAVCYRDLATVYEEDHKPDSCIASIITAKDIWNERNDTFRLFDANNILLRVYASANNLKDAEAVFRQNEAMMQGPAMQVMHRAWMEILDYYKSSQAYFAKKGDDKMEEEYATMYKKYKEQVIAAGIKTN